MADIKKVLGIDLGTTYSSVATIDDFDRAVVVNNDMNEPTTASAVYFESDTNTVVGVEAKNMAEIEPEHVVQFVKQFMGHQDKFLFEYNGKNYAPEEISAIILKGLVEKARQNLDVSIHDVVITVPAYFDDAQRVATRNAGIMAGLNVLDIINEPIAAALSYAWEADGQNKEEIILVYDLGGGTFDVTVIKVGKDGVKILVAGGKNDLGGKNWDDRLITYLAAKFEEENGVNPLTDRLAHQEQRTKAEIAKKSLTARAKVPFTFTFAGFKWRAEVVREKFEEITADLLDLTIQLTHETLDALQANTGNRTVDRFLLVGGSSRMPMVKARIDREFAVDSVKYDPDECVAKGAALWGVKLKIDRLAKQAGFSIETGKGNKEPFDKELSKELEGVKNVDVYKRLTMPGKTWGNVSSHTYGILAYKGDEKIIVPLVVQNTEIPFTYTSSDGQFSTVEEDQATIDLVLMEADGESLDPAFCKEIGRGTVQLPRGVPKWSEVKILFDFEGDGTIKLRAREVSSNRECEVKLTRTGVMDDARLHDCLGKRALELKATRDFDGAMRLFKEQERICRRLNDPNGLAISLVDQASLLAFALSRPEDSLPLAEEAARIASKHVLRALAQQIEPLVIAIRDLVHPRPTYGVGPGSDSSETLTGGRDRPAPDLVEDVQFTVFRPKVVRPDTWYSLLAFAHLSERPPDAPESEPDPVEEVRRQAEQVLGASARDYQNTTQDSQQAVPREGGITFVPEIPGFEFNPPRRTFVWQESVHKEEFRCRGSQELHGKTARGRLTVFLGSIILAEVSLSIRVDRDQPLMTPEDPRPTEHARPYRRIFASYSHKDIEIVRQFEWFARTLGDEYLRDWVHLRAGEVWSDRLLRLIDEADIFQLFWSSNSMGSEYVRQEWEYALSLRRPQFIRPTYWEEPLPHSPQNNLPPEALLKLHFQQIPVKPSRVQRLPPTSSDPPASAVTDAERDQSYVQPRDGSDSREEIFDDTEFELEYADTESRVSESDEEDEDQNAAFLDPAGASVSREDEEEEDALGGEAGEVGSAWEVESEEWAAAPAAGRRPSMPVLARCAADGPSARFKIAAVTITLILVLIPFLFLIYLMSK